MSHPQLDTSAPPLLPPRDPRGHKGTFGTVAVVGGSCASDRRMIGAPALSAIAALRAGAGLATLVTPAPILPAAITIAPSATGVALPVDHSGELIAHEAVAVLDRVIAAATAVAIGPGMGAGPGVQALVVRAIQREDRPIVIDADALNALAAVPALSQDFRAQAVLTPHPGEFARLAAALRITLDPVAPATRPAAAESLAQRLGCVVVLKGSGTVVSDGQRTWVCPAGHACLATAGTGDVLTGLLAGLLAQHPLKPGSITLYDAARIAVLAHARAGERWAHAHDAHAGLIASELADLLPHELNQLQTR